jgi:putative tryptophan/tyrosine transport system substrate-binding protein
MKRREAISLLGGAAVAGWIELSTQAPARAAGKIARVGLLTLSAPAEIIDRFAALRDGMHELGYLEGQNIVFEARFAEGRVDRLTALTAQLLQANVDVIVTSGHPAIRALQMASSTTPIVAAIMSDPVEEGFAVSYARPGGNITGLAFQDAELITKRLEILKEVVPSLSHVAVLSDPGMPASLLTATESTAHALGLTLKVLPAGNLTEIGKAFDALGSNAQALFEISSPRFAATRVAIAASAIKKGLPAACEEREFAAAGCLVSYGPSFTAMFRRAAYYVDKILKGSRPADLPIEQPTKFELVINLKTAKALGLTVAPVLLSRADEVIE